MKTVQREVCKCLGCDAFSGRETYPSLDCMRSVLPHIDQQSCNILCYIGDFILTDSMFDIIGGEMDNEIGP